MPSFSIVFKNSNNISEQEVKLFALFIKSCKFLYKEYDIEIKLTEQVKNLLEKIIDAKDFKLTQINNIIDIINSKNYNLAISGNCPILAYKKLDKIENKLYNLESLDLPILGNFIKSPEGPKGDLNYFVKASNYNDLVWLYIASIAYPKAKENVTSTIDVKPEDLYWFSNSIFLKAPKQILSKTIKTTDNPDEAKAFIFYSDQIANLIFDKYFSLINPITYEFKAPIYTIEAGFISSVILFQTKNSPEVNLKFASPMSFNLSTKSHYDISSPIKNTLEYMLTEGFEELNPMQLMRAKIIMNRIKDYKISKYNCQFNTDTFNGIPTAIIIDQAYNDKSISLSNASAKTFQEMLDYAIDNVPEDWNLFIKIHPEQLCGRRQGYFTNNKNSNLLGQIYIPENCRAKWLPAVSWNPIDMLMKCKTVFTVGSQMGFEALICGKEVITFGVPFYAGYGLTTDLNSSSRLKIRNKYPHSLEEIFYTTYIKYTKYYDTLSVDMFKEIEIEDCLEILKRKIKDYRKNFMQ